MHVLEPFSDKPVVYTKDRQFYRNMIEIIERLEIVEFPQLQGMWYKVVRKVWGG